MGKRSLGSPAHVGQGPLDMVAVGDHGQTSSSGGVMISLSAEPIGQSRSDEFFEVIPKPDL